MQGLFDMALQLAVHFVPHAETQEAAASALLQACEAAVDQQMPLRVDIIAQLAALPSPGLRPGVGPRMPVAPCTCITLLS